MSLNILDMQWLPGVGGKFREILRTLGEGAEFSYAKARSLATSRLDLSQLHTFARVLSRQADPGGDGSVSLSILSNATADLIASSVIATAPRHGLWINAHVAPFGTFATEAFDVSSETNTRRDDFVLLALDHKGFNLTSCPGDLIQANTVVADCVSQVQKFVAAIREASGATVIVQTLPLAATSEFGSFDVQLPGTLSWLIHRFNVKLCEAMSSGVLVLDVAGLAQMVGLSQWHDPVQWNLGKFSFSQRVVPLYAEWLCRLIAASKGRSKKCLVLDLDNTLWGGVIGDDGLQGVVLGQGSALGEAYLSVQEMALMLRERGILLAVCSKNEDVIARKMFREHPEMYLREEHIAVFQANWQDKASNLVAIAETLNIGVDTLVFMDDNPAERHQVRMALPQVAVPELPDNPDYFASILLSAGYFEATQFTSDDRKRADHYKQNAARRAVLGDSTNLAEYLESLEMEAYVSTFDAIGRSRITQLINKTNQFNLTTRRYSESAVEKIESDASIIDLQIRLRDRYGDNGMICVVICKVCDAALVIDTWLMSCRVLNRRVEELVLNLLVSIARQRKLNRVIGTYRPTEKNEIVRDLYSRLGFEFQSESSEGTHWSLELSSYSASNVPIKLTLSPDIELHESAGGIA